MPMMTRSEYARHRGVSKAYMSKAAVRRRLAAATVTENGKEKIDSDAADRIMEATRDPSRYLGRAKKAALPPDPQESGMARPETFEDTKRQREQVKLEQERLNLAARKEQTMLRQDVERACLAAAQAIRQHMRARNRYVAEKAATMNDARAIRIMLDEDDRGMFDFLSHEFARKLSLPLAEGGGGSIPAN